MTDVAPPPRVHLYQIAHSAAAVDMIQPGYRLLDNLDNPRPDGFEYWPMRRFLLQQPLDEAVFYGFFSPKFGAKTGLSHAEVVGFVQAQSAVADVLLFSPQPDMGAFSLNVFEQGETFDAGLIDAYSALLTSVGRPAPLRQLVMDSRQIVFSNYFVARPAFWREWLTLNDALFAACEDPQHPLHGQLCKATSSGQGTQRKVFLQERATSLLLAVQPQWRSQAYNPFSFGWSASRLREHPTEATARATLAAASVQRRRHRRELAKVQAPGLPAALGRVHAWPEGG